MSKNLSFSQEFATAWPAVVEEMKDFANMRLILADDWQAVEIRLTISRNLVQAQELRPQVDELREFLQRIRKSRVLMQSSAVDTHRLEMFFRR